MTKEEKEAVRGIMQEIMMVTQHKNADLLLVALTNLTGLLAGYVANSSAAQDKRDEMLDVLCMDIRRFAKAGGAIADVLG